ncbi:MAG: YveK family protein [Eubacterium sp.]
MEENREINIDLRKIFSMLKKKFIFIIIISIIGGVLAGCITNFFIEPKYTASIKMHVYSSNDNRVASNSSISSSEFDASQKLVNTYLVVVESKTFSEKVADKLGGNIEPDLIRSMMSCAAIQDTLAFQVNVTSPDPQQAMDIANAIADTCPDEIVRILKVGGVEVIDYASLPTSPSSPNLEKNVMIGLLFSFAVSFVFFFIKELFDTSITDEKDLEREFDIPILGTIPRLVPVTEKAKTDTKSNLEPPKPPIDALKNEKEGANND